MAPADWSEQAAKLHATQAQAHELQVGKAVCAALGKLLLNSFISF